MYGRLYGTMEGRNVVLNPVPSQWTPLTTKIMFEHQCSLHKWPGSKSIDDTKKSPEKTSSREKLTKSGPNIGTPVVLAKFILPREVPWLMR